MNSYKKFKEKMTKEVNSLPMIFAFSNEQFEEGKKKLGVKENSELVSIGAGGFMKKNDIQLLRDMRDRHNKEFAEKIKDDKFLYEAFLHELWNHEFCITFDPEPTVNALCFTMEEFEKDERALKIFKKAKKDYLEGCDY